MGNEAEKEKGAINLTPMSRRAACGPAAKAERDKIFVREYIANGGHGTKAAVAAGYSPRTARVAASRLLQQDNIKQQIAAAGDKCAKKIELTIEKVLADIEETRKLALDAKRFGDAIRGSELQGKFLKMFTDKIEHSGSVTISKEQRDAAVAAALVAANAEP